MMKNILLFVLTLYVANLKATDSALSPSGANVCKKEFKYTVSRLQPYVRYGFTRDNPFFCSGCTENRHRWVTYYATKVVYDTKIHTTYECCSGYRQVADKCVPRKCDNDMLMELLMVLGPVIAVFIFTSIIIGWILCKCKKEILSNDPVHPVGKYERRLKPSPCKFKALEANKKHRGEENIYQQKFDSKTPFPLLQPLCGNYEYSSDRRGGITRIIPVESMVLYADVRCDDERQKVRPASNLAKERGSIKYAEIDLAGLESSKALQAKEKHGAVQEVPAPNSSLPLLEPVHENDEDLPGLEPSSGHSTALQANEQHGVVLDIYQEVPAPKSPIKFLEPSDENCEDSPEAGQPRVRSPVNELQPNELGANPEYPHNKL